MGRGKRKRKGASLAFCVPQPSCVARQAGARASACVRSHRARPRAAPFTTGHSSIVTPARAPVKPFQVDVGIKAPLDVEHCGVYCSTQHLEAFVPISDGRVCSIQARLLLCELSRSPAFGETLALVPHGPSLVQYSTAITDKFASPCGSCVRTPRSWHLR
ncbi:unnamed protein product [Ascophyllum nodosum]